MLSEVMMPAQIELPSMIHGMAQDILVYGVNLFNNGSWSHDSRPHKYTVYFNDYQ
mgnify:FL=1